MHIHRTLKLLVPLLAIPIGLRGQDAGPSASGTETPVLTLHLDTPGVSVSPTLYGLMTEEINHSYDGGLYAELIQNRIFKDDPNAPAHWSLVQDAGAAGSIVLDQGQPINSALTVCLKLDVTQPGKRAGIANDGFWGIPVKPSTAYRASFYAKAAQDGAGPLTVSIESIDGSIVYAQAPVPKIGTTWQRYSVILSTTADVSTTKNARFVISTTSPGTLWFNLVSLFPPTYDDRPNGNRIDIMQLLEGMQPTFLRLPGGNYVEGDTFDSRYAWKTTIGPLDQRPGHPGCWRYRSSDGMGLIEFLEWCEDLKMQPVLALFAGYTLKHDHVEGPALRPYVDEAIEEIEYVTGDKSTKWGAERAKDGHPRPFPLTYVEVGNEDSFDKSGSYDGRFAQFYDAIKAKYPQLQVIATTRVKSRVPDAIDEHYYRSSAQMEGDAKHYDGYKRSGPKVFVGEWATRSGAWHKTSGQATPNLAEALSDAAWLTGLERNSDIVVMQCYAPLFVNVSPGARQWEPDLIGYDALTSYGSPSYYAQKMFSTHLGDKVVQVTGQNIPMQDLPSDKPGQPAHQIPALFYVATRDTKAGTIYLKVVNPTGDAHPVRIDLDGAGQVAPEGESVVLSADKPEDTNSITEPAKVVPVTSNLDGLGKSFSHTFAPYSVNVLQISAQ